MSAPANASSPSPSKDPATPSPERQAALLTLLADDDAAISNRIREQLVSGGAGSLAWLRTHRLHADPAVRRQVQGILDQFSSARADTDFLSFILSHGEHFDLEDAVWRLVLTRYPEAPVAGYVAQIDEWAGRLRLQMASVATGEEMLGRINSLLFGELGFRGNAEHYFDPANSYLNLVMDRRLGIPITLCAVYLFICRRLSLPVTGIGMPGHFLCRYQTPREEHYIDAFHGGQLLTRIECLRRLKQFAVEYDESAVQPISPRRFLQRMVANLHLVHKEHRERAEADRLQRYLVALTR
jgi:regulator of sirC expression with transglutaminase-like and TPR domain